LIDVAVRMNYGPCVDRLLVGDRLAVRRGADGAIRFRFVLNLTDIFSSCKIRHDYAGRRSTGTGYLQDYPT
jgi:hypothetical protein